MAWAAVWQERIESGRTEPLALRWTSQGTLLLAGTGAYLGSYLGSMPALPADFPTRTLDAIVPIEFFLNR